VSKGPAPVEVPPIIGTLITDATTALGALGLTTETIREDFDDSAAGTILLSDPVPGTTVPKGTVIKVVVSKGPVLVEVPNVEELSTAEATAILEAAGFKVKVVNKFSIVKRDEVYAQIPVATNMAPKGSIVTIEII
jgi:serine/threonine-protein kinase